KAARDAFTADHKRRMKKYKDKRYSGWTGKARCGFIDHSRSHFSTALGGARRARTSISTSTGGASDRGLLVGDGATPPRHLAP
ncbi:hypothetical protein, partial [Streptomyces sp. NPDC001787]|uniref:hypothetical protein n=1 Tax=Streptomyces sp. NPDC001787 TaxID=3154523 RepID=UPI003319A6DB